VDERAIVSLPKVSSPSRARTARVRSASLSLWLTRLVLIAVPGGSLLPTPYSLALSFNGGESQYTSTLIPQTFTLENYSRLLNESKFSLWVRNSLILGIGAGILSLLCATFGGYAFSRFHFRGRRHGILLLFIVQMLPSTVSIVAIFRMLHLAGLINKLEGLILVFGLGTIALSVWLLKNYLDSIPRELDESAQVDGADHWQVFWQILFPLLQPMLVAQFIFHFIGVYNEYLTATIVLSDPDLYPLGVGLRAYVSGAYQTNWTAFCAASVLGSLPILAIFFLAQRLLVEGLTRGALKG